LGILYRLIDGLILFCSKYLRAQLFTTPWDGARRAALS
jgi:hypothetical protein